MRPLFLFACFFTLLLPYSTQGQNSYRENFVEGNYLILEDNYSKALDNFIAAYKIDSSSANINYLVGMCYMKSIAQKDQAIYYLKKAAKSVSEKYTPFDVKEKSAPVTVYYYLGSAYHLGYQIDSAIVNYEKYKTYLKPKQIDLLKDAEHQIEMCKNAKEYLALPTSIKITNLGDSVNNAYPDYSPVISADESMLIFTSRRPGSTGDDRTADDQFYEDIYVCYKKPDGGWTSPVPIGSNINTPAHEATIGLSADGSQLFIYKDDNGDGNIYLSILEGDTWSTPKKLGSDINTTAWEPSACLTPEGNTLYFVSERKGGYGGRDLYKCVRLPNGEWSLATNMGPSLNTEFDEDAPFIHPNRTTLFFSSKGHKSMGGFDIFYANKTDSGWTIPTNLLYPINTPDDDVFYVSSTDGKRAYYSSVRKDGLGEKDIYMITLEEGPKLDPVALIIGKLIPENGSLIPKEMEITVTNVETDEVGYFKANSKSGKYVLPLIPGKSYNVVYKLGDTQCYNETINVPEGTDYQEIQKEIFLDPVTLKCTSKTPPPIDEKKIIEKPIKEKAKVEKKTIVAAEVTKPEPLVVKQPKAYTDQTYKVQISSVRRPAPYDAFKGITDVEYEKTEKGWYKYYVGTYKSFKEAKTRKDEMIKKGFDDSFVVPFTGTLLPFDATPPGQPAESIESLSNSSSTEFEMFFKYNVTEINNDDSDFKTFIDNLAGIINTNGKVNLSIVSSASLVPTRAFKNNKELAENRAENAKNKIINSLKEKGIDSSKINFTKIKSSVNGPKYNDDYLINKGQYQKFQYIRIIIEN